MSLTIFGLFIKYFPTNLSLATLYTIRSLEAVNSSLKIYRYSKISYLFASLLFHSYCPSSTLIIGVQNPLPSFLFPFMIQIGVLNQFYDLRSHKSRNSCIWRLEIPSRITINPEEFLYSMTGFSTPCPYIIISGMERDHGFFLTYYIRCI